MGSVLAVKVRGEGARNNWEDVMTGAPTHRRLPPWEDAQAMGLLRRQLMSFALARVGDQQLAEDVVQETLVAAVRDEARFAGRSAFTTWVTAILRHKIADADRAKTTKELQVDLEEDTTFAASYTKSGEWRSDAKPAEWGDPDVSWQQREFMSVFERCVADLPPAQGRAFVMKEVLGVQLHDIASELDVPKATISVWLHRARHRLRNCLEQKWFTDPGAEGGRS